MPMYAYQCANGHDTEALRPFKERIKPGPTCPECGEPTAYVIAATRRRDYNLDAGNRRRARENNISEI